MHCHCPVYTTTTTKIWTCNIFLFRLINLHTRHVLWKHENCLNAINLRLNGGNWKWTKFWTFFFFLLLQKEKYNLKWFVCVSSSQFSFIRFSCRVRLMWNVINIADVSFVLFVSMPMPSDDYLFIWLIKMTKRRIDCSCLIHTKLNVRRWALRHDNDDKIEFVVASIQFFALLNEGKRYSVQEQTNSFKKKNPIFQLNQLWLYI